MTSFINKDRYVKVTDLQLGLSQSYTDFEELAFSDLDDTAELVMEVINGMTEYSGNVMLSPPVGAPDNKSAVWSDDQPLQQDIRDILFYNVIHVVSAWIDCDIPFDREKIETVVDSSRHLLEDVLTCGWVMRKDA